MSAAPSASPRRYLAVWFPLLSSDRLRREAAKQGCAEPDDGPVVLVDKVKGALRLAALNGPALALGLAPGMTLADAQARTPDLRTVLHQPQADAALLARVLEDFGRFTPMAAPDGADALILDVTGCAHLFGDEAGLVRAVRARGTRIGLETRAVLAGTPQAARALVRFGPDRMAAEGVIASGRDRAAVRALPIVALELDDREHQALARAGLRTLGDLDDRPTAPLAARFGAELPVRLARILGQEDVRITPFRAPPPCVVDRILFEPITETTDVEAVIGDLLVGAMAWLDERRLGGRAFEAGFFRVDGATRRITVRTGRATRDAPGVMRLFRERLAALARPLDPGFGFDHLRLSVPVTQVMAPAQAGFDQPARGTEELDRLIDRLTARLGPEAVARFEPVESHLPERAARLVWAGRRQGETVWPARDPESPPLRPLQMFDPPQPIETVSLAPDGPPARFRWRRVTHAIVLAEGPERIGAEWWRGPGHRTRDYYRLEDRQGRRFWVFRAGLYGEEREPSWYIHGLFA